MLQTRTNPNSEGEQATLDSHQCKQREACYRALGSARGFAAPAAITEPHQNGSGVDRLSPYSSTFPNTPTSAAPTKARNARQPRKTRDVNFVCHDPDHGRRAVCRMCWMRTRSSNTR